MKGPKNSMKDSSRIIFYELLRFRIVTVLMSKFSLLRRGVTAVTSMSKTMILAQNSEIIEGKSL